MKVLVYVEGPSDRNALDALLYPIIDEGRKKGIGIKFLPQKSKDRLLNEVPRKAADHLSDHPRDWVFALPDLYPMSSYSGTRNQHSSFEELGALLHNRFEERAEEMKLPGEVRERFRVHCLKHDLEALILAAPDILRQRLGTEDSLEKAWRKPVEDQDDEQPPKQKVKALFLKYKKRRYVEISDARWILERADLGEIEKTCQQRFSPFVTDLRLAVSL